MTGTSSFRSRAIFALQVILILGAAWSVFSPAVRGGWLWDDNTDITGNAVLNDPAALRKIWFAPESLDYYPIKATVQWVQWRWWGDRTLGYHLTNVVLHVLGAFLFWRVLRQLGVKQAWLGGLFFVVHPVVVESVAWIAELKNTLSLPPLLLAFSAYLKFDVSGSAFAEAPADRPGPSRGRRYFLISLAWFVIAMLCKSSVVMFPFALLLYAWWKRGRVGGRDFRASLPFFAVSLVLGLVTVGLQRHHLTGADMVSLGGMLSRLAGAGLAAAFYFSKCVFPVGLMPIYPRWNVDPLSLLPWLPWCGFAALLGWLWSKRAGWGRHALFGLGWFLLNLVPVLGLVAISYLRFTWVMDHLAYVSLLGILALAAAGAGAGYDRLVPGLRPWAAAAVVGLAGILAVQSREYAANFRSSEALWTLAVRRNPGAWIAHFNLGVAENDAGRPEQALEQYEAALKLRPDYAEAQNNLAGLLLARGRVPEAIVHAEQAVRLQPNFVDAHAILGNALQSSGRDREAVAQFEEAVRIDPGFVDAHEGLCDSLVALGRLDEAIAQGREAERLAPGAGAVHNSLGMALRAAGRVPEAIEQYRRASQLDPGDAVIHSNLATALAIAGRLPEAIAEYREALRLQPDRAQTHSNLGLALAKSGRIQDALSEYQAALRLDPGLYEAHLNLGNALRALGHPAEAKVQLDEAAKLLELRRAANH